INYSKMGDYVMKVTNGSLPGLEIEEQPLTILAETDFFGFIEYQPGGDTTAAFEGLPEAQMFVYRLKDGPFVLEDSTEINSDGSYIFEEVILGDFVVQVDPGDAYDEVLQTYYVSVQDWLDADTLQLRDVTTGIDIRMVGNPGAFPVDDLNTGVIGGDLIDSTSTGGSETNARIDTRRRVKKAGCSLRRKTQGGGGRGENETDEYELVAYVETDDNGRFSFENIPDGEYRLNIQYPGVPMDESTNIDFIIGAGGDIENNSFELEAVITDTGIEVGVVEELGDLKPYLKDVLLYPNPTEGILTFDYRVYRSLDNLRAEIYTITGLKLLDTEINHNMGRQRTTLDLTELEGGVYFLRLTDGAQSVSDDIKVIKK
ncbi:unnamed protein product, partial [Symbiodinium microadriaticum]